MSSGCCTGATAKPPITLKKAPAASQLFVNFQKTKVRRRRASFRSGAGLIPLLRDFVHAAFAATVSAGGKFQCLASVVARGSFVDSSCRALGYTRSKSFGRAALTRLAPSAPSW